MCFGWEMIWILSPVPFRWKLACLLASLSLSLLGSNHLIQCWMKWLYFFVNKKTPKGIIFRILVNFWFILFNFKTWLWYTKDSYIKCLRILCLLLKIILYMFKKGIQHPKPTVEKTQFSSVKMFKTFFSFIVIIIIIKIILRILIHSTKKRVQGLCL